MNKRHLFFYGLFRPLVILYCFFRFGYRFRTAARFPGNYIVLSNHVTDFDPLFVGASFRRHMYFVGSEHIARWGWKSRFIAFTLDPIIRFKGTVGLSTIVETLKRLKNGSNVCLFAEGVRTWDGVTCPIAPSASLLIKRAGCGLVTYKISGGYLTSPGWCDGNFRRGRIFGRTIRYLSPEEIKTMTPSELQTIIESDLHEDADLTQDSHPIRYRGRRLAEHLENLLFICPFCLQRHTLITAGNTVTCAACGKSFTLDEYGRLHGLNLKSGLHFKTIRRLSDWQKEEITRDVENEVPYRDECTVLISISEDHRETAVETGPLTLTPSALTVGSFSVPTAKIVDMGIHGRHALVFSVGRSYYELRPQGPNAIRFLFYYQVLKKKGLTKSSASKTA